MPPRRLAILIVGGVLVLLVVGWAVVEYRRRTIAQYDTPTAREQWRAYQQQESIRSSSPDSTVKRRLPTIQEPPGLVMMRDRFPVILVASLVSAAFFYALLAFLLNGALCRPAQRHHHPP